MMLTDVDRDKTYTYANYCSWDIAERVELINGKVFEMIFPEHPL